MGGERLRISNTKENGFSSIFCVGLQWSPPEEGFRVPPGVGLPILGKREIWYLVVWPPNPANSKDSEGGFKLSCMDLYMMYVSTSKVIFT